jgi:hypothetical protein
MDNPRKKRSNHEEQIPFTNISSTAQTDEATPATAAAPTSTEPDTTAHWAANDERPRRTAPSAESALGTHEDHDGPQEIERVQVPRQERRTVLSKCYGDVTTIDV